jgi:hypothetical protein
MTLRLHQIIPCGLLLGAGPTSAGDLSAIKVSHPKATPGAALRVSAELSSPYKSNNDLVSEGADF